MYSIHVYRHDMYVIILKQLIWEAILNCKENGQYSEISCYPIYAPLVMVHNPAHDLFSIGNFLCRVRVVDCCDLRNGAERQWFIVAMISGNFCLLKSLMAGTTTVMHRYGPKDIYPCVFYIKRTPYPYLLADFYDASQFEMINFAKVNIHYNSDPVISLFGNMQIMFQYIEYDVTRIN